MDDIDGLHELDPVRQVDHKDERCDDIGRLCVEVCRFCVEVGGYMVVWCGGVVVLGGMQVLAFTAGHWCFWVGRRNRPKQRNSKKIRGNQTVPGPGVGLPRRGEEGSGTGTGTGTGTKFKNRTFTQGEE